MIDKEIINENFTFTSGKWKYKDINYLINNLRTDYLNWFLPRNKNLILSSKLLNRLCESVEIKLGRNFRNILSKMESEVSYKVLKLSESRLNTRWTNIEICNENNQLITFITPFSKKSGKMKVSRFISNLLQMNNISESPSKIEEFLLEYLSLLKNTNNDIMKVVSGMDIIKYYNEGNYHKTSGTLGNSCMRYVYQKDKINFYSKNKDIEMLVMLDDFDKVKGRALIWRNCDIVSSDIGLKKGDILDRIYVNNSKDRSKFIKWGIDNKLIVRKNFRAGSRKDFIVNGETLKLSIKKNNLLCNNDYPYLDTFFLKTSNRSVNVSNY